MQAYNPWDAFWSGFNNMNTALDGMEKIYKDKRNKEASTDLTGIRNKYLFRNSGEGEQSTQATTQEVGQEPVVNNPVSQGLSLTNPTPSDQPVMVKGLNLGVTRQDINQAGDNREIAAGLKSIGHSEQDINQALDYVGGNGVEPPKSNKLQDWSNQRKELLSTGKRVDANTAFFESIKKTGREVADASPEDLRELANNNKLVNDAAVASSHFLPAKNFAISFTLGKMLEGNGSSLSLENISKFTEDSYFGGPGTSVVDGMTDGNKFSLLMKGQNGDLYRKDTTVDAIKKTLKKNENLAFLGMQKEAEFNKAMGDWLNKYGDTEIGMKVGEEYFKDMKAKKEREGVLYNLWGKTDDYMATLGPNFEETKASLTWKSKIVSESGANTADIKLFWDALQHTVDQKIKLATAKKEKPETSKEHSFTESNKNGTDKKTTEIGRTFAITETPTSLKDSKDNSITKFTDANGRVAFAPVGGMGQLKQGSNGIISVMGYDTDKDGKININKPLVEYHLQGGLKNVTKANHNGLDAGSDGSKGGSNKYEVNYREIIGKILDEAKVVIDNPNSKPEDITKAKSAEQNLRSFMLGGPITPKDIKVIKAYAQDYINAGISVSGSSSQEKIDKIFDINSASNSDSNVKKVIKKNGASK